MLERNISELQKILRIGKTYPANLPTPGTSHMLLEQLMGNTSGKNVQKRVGHFIITIKDFIVLFFAVCDANYCFTLFDIGAYDSNNDSGVLVNSEMGMRLQNKRFNVSLAEELVGCSHKPLPFFLLEDEIFPLKT